MKKLKLFASCLLLSGLIFGCSGKDVDTHADVSYGSNRITNVKSLKVNDVYNYLLENQSSEIAKKILLQVMKENVNLDFDLETLYQNYLNEYFKNTFVENSTYQYYGEFSEDILVSYLRSESYDIRCGEGYSAGYLDSSNFSCDYSDYIEKNVDYDIYLKLLKIKYIIDEKSNMIDKSEARNVTYYSVKRGTDDKVLENLKSYVKSFEENYNSTDSEKIKNIEDVAKIDLKEALDEIEKQYNYLKTSTDSPNYEYLTKFTTCGDKRCAVEDGLAHQIKEIENKEYYTNKVVIKGNTDILFETARELLFSSNIEDYLYAIGDVKYLINPASYNEEDTRVSDIILYEGATSGTHSSSNLYYLARVDIIDSNSTFLEQASVAELLLDKISDGTIFDKCFEDVELTIYDQDIRELFVTTYGDYEGE